MTKPTPPLDPRVFSPRAGERTAAIATAAIGAALVVVAAGIFIAIKWETMGLSGKAGVVGLVALVALSGGHFLKRSVPGVAAVLTHLGAFLIPIDVGGVATSVGLSHPEVCLTAGAVGVAVLTALDRLRSPFMALGRVLSIGAAAIGAGSLLGLPPALLLAATAAIGAAVFTRTGRLALDVLGLSLLASTSPAFSFASAFTSDGSLVTWLAEQSDLLPLAASLIGVAAIGSSLVVNRQWPGLAVSGAIAVISLPSLIATVGDYTGQTMVFLAATVVVCRVAVERLGLPGWQHYIDLLTFAVTAFLAVLAVDRFGPNLDWALMGSAALLAISWLLSDFETGRRVEAGSAWYLRLWRGDSGLVSTLGLAGAAVLLAAGTDTALTSACVVMAASVLIGLSKRPHATVVARIGFPIAALLTLGEPFYALAFGLAAALFLQARASLDLFKGGSPRLALATQLSGLIGLSVTVLRFAVSAWDEPLAVNLVAAALIAIALVVLALTADQLPVPDLRSGPRVLLIASVLPLVNEISVAGVWAVMLAGVLVADFLLHRLPLSEIFAAPTLIAGTWMIGVGEAISAAEMYAIGPALVMLWFGARSMRDGTSSWIGIAPAVVLLGGAAVLERLDQGAGWHSAVAGATGLVALGVGVERKWAGSAVVGTGILAATVLIEASAVVPRIPVWMLLATGGMALLGTGMALERRAGLGGTASFRATWAQFR